MVEFGVKRLVTDHFFTSRKRPGNKHTNHDSYQFFFFRNQIIAFKSTFLAVNHFFFAKFFNFESNDDSTFFQYLFYLPTK